MGAFAMGSKCLMRRRTGVRLALAVAASASLASVVFAASTRARPEVVSLAGGLDPLRQAFAASDGRPRYLALVSPT